MADKALSNFPSSSSFFSCSGEIPIFLLTAESNPLSSVSFGLKNLLFRQLADLWKRKLWKTLQLPQGQSSQKRLEI